MYTVSLKIVYKFVVIDLYFLITCREKYSKLKHITELAYLVKIYSTVQIVR